MLIGRSASEEYAAAMGRRSRAQWEQPGFRERFSASVRSSCEKPQTKVNRSRARVKVCDRKRGGCVPEGYEEHYIYLRKRVGAKEALRLVRLQRGADLRNIGGANHLG